MSDTIDTKIALEAAWIAIAEPRNERIKELETALQIMVNAYKINVEVDGRYDVALSYALKALGDGE